MYSGTTLRATRRFDAWFGAHQKIDRTARRHLRDAVPAAMFPSAKEVLQFEGLDGPDGIKRKTPATGEPWHYYDPYNHSDDRIIEIIESHYTELVQALRLGDRERAAFEAAWLAHALVDGLTPAHHYPYEEKLIELRGGEGIETRTTVKEKLVMHGETLPERLSNNWKMWGDKGLIATHFAFEWGVAAMIAPLKLGMARPTDHELRWIRQTGLPAVFKARAHEIAELHMYEQFYKSAWTPRLAKLVRRELVPRIVNTVTLAWYNALQDAREY